MVILKKRKKTQTHYSQKRLIRSRLSRVRTRDLSRSRNIFLGIVALILFSLLILGVFKLFSSHYFIIKNVEVIGSRDITEEDTKLNLDYLYGQNIFVANSISIRNKLLQKHTSLEDVRVRKIWPSKIIIIVSEKQPLFLYNNLSGVYVVTEDGYISEIVFQEKINFAEEQISIITGAKGIDSDLVKERIQSEYVLEQEKLPTNQRTDFNYSTIAEDIKLSTLSIIRAELLEQTKVIIASYKEKYDPTTYPQLTSVYSFDTSKLREGDGIDKKKLQLTREVIRYFNRDKSENIVEIIWESKYAVRFETESRKTIVFGTSRNTSEQLDDYIIVKKEIEEGGKNYSEMDLTSRKISVR